MLPLIEQANVDAAIILPRVTPRAMPLYGLIARFTLFI